MKSFEVELAFSPLHSEHKLLISYWKVAFKHEFHKDVFW